MTDTKDCIEAARLNIGDARRRLIGIPYAQQDESGAQFGERVIVEVAADRDGRGADRIGGVLTFAEGFPAVWCDRAVEAPERVSSVVRNPVQS